jgi:hypothetical protein
LPNRLTDFYECITIYRNQKPDSESLPGFCRLIWRARPCVEVGRPDQGVLVVDEQKLAVDEGRGLVIDADAVLKKFPVIGRPGGPPHIGEIVALGEKDFDLDPPWGVKYLIPRRRNRANTSFCVYIAFPLNGRYSPEPIFVPLINN